MKKSIFLWFIIAIAMMLMMFPFAVIGADQRAGPETAIATAITPTDESIFTMDLGQIIFKDAYGLRLTVHAISIAAHLNGKDLDIMNVKDLDITMVKVKITGNVEAETLQSQTPFIIEVVTVTTPAPEPQYFVSAIYQGRSSSLFAALCNDVVGVGHGGPVAKFISSSLSAVYNTADRVHSLGHLRC